MPVLTPLAGGIFLGWALGANDAANVFGTAVASRIITFRICVAQDRATSPSTIVCGHIAIDLERFVRFELSGIDSIYSVAGLGITR